MSKEDLLDPDKIQANLKTKRIGKKVLVYKSTSSTNDIATEYAKKKNNDGLVIFAEEQNAGRGRAGTKWQSHYADSILCSIILTDCEINSELLSLTIAVAVADALGKVGKYEAKIKWPNDIIVNGKKVAGILLESKRAVNRTAYIVGIGINCHQKKKSFPAELQSAATSIDIESGSTCDRISLAKRLLSSLDEWLEQKDKKKVTDQWYKRSILLGHRVTLLYNGKRFTGNCVGLDPEKGLILQLNIGGVRMFQAAHTTVVK
jgi:BirA family biotin operon repressor/biotin-[acetyl-CoA-carboxylase] ligase